MTAQLLDGAALAQTLRAQGREHALALAAAGTVPGLAVVLVGDDPASQVYVRHKLADSEANGLRATLHRHPASLSEDALLQQIAALNEDPAVHGILVQLPLPRGIRSERVIAAIAPHKDVDGFHLHNAGALFTGQAGFRPCTPAGCMRLIETAGYDLRGKHAVVLGRSNIVGKPMALMLLAANASVTLCHSATPDLSVHTRAADVLVAAVGRVGLVSADMVKPGALVIDVGMNRNATGKLCGDVDFAAVRERAGWITPVPGGVGPMTRAMLLLNTLEAAQRAHTARQ